ncbi:ribonuclease P protein subunit p21-like [Mercenaria mercenaria]|uniref:ribonuclease P protein subunit p21-like n=1 Tax=Mercenaria mercenaria TaxID=6596 RepID=UPI00234F0B61|nr:ribonuclease P protein subunit p21-like [Mercenaria mercenaria]
MVKIKGIAFEDVHKRVNFLYQAAYQSLLRNPEDLSLCRFYINTLMVIARRQGIQLHPDMKRKLCKRCCVLLMPGVTAIYRVKKKRQKQTVVTCLECGTFRRFIYNGKNIPWMDRQEAWIDTVVSGQSVTVHQQQRHKGSNKGGNKTKGKGKGNQTKETNGKLNMKQDTQQAEEKSFNSSSGNSGQSDFSNTWTKTLTKS